MMSVHWDNAGHLSVTQDVDLAATTRADPPLQLGSLRAAGEVLEIRAAQLGFSLVLPPLWALAKVFGVRPYCHRWDSRI
jgi:hypothetical protein